ncbi:oxygen-independent coproporphyrinogen III oxidase [Dokdonella koreensis]|uniref:Coproporphyrinogen-III oxidase n=1 Tax=Dokdonella koreensis DS-123 TaxID=1300342 RepID=A0A160DW21_9GAMM|nr:oxygen-independent coproporphyrinogen III oxidase [Dokdonella koreensis]ANB18381.1 Coproporphyrinogen III oxidase, oxygen-independent [Dokdonella koreensis DS-123]
MLPALAALPAAGAPPVFDPALIARYDTSGPRYTSYPTAPQFRDDFGEADFRHAAQASNEDPIPRPLSLYLHVPFCASPCFYCGCNRIITRDRRKADRYLARLCHEIDRIAPLFDRDRPLQQLHLGGGTPNFFDARQLRTLVGTIDGRFTLAGLGQREFGIEIDPRGADAAYVHQLAELGFDRLSLGIQDFDADVQRAINRVQDPAQVGEVIDAAHAHGFRSVSVDLIYGLPRQTPERFRRTLEQVAALRPQRIVTYAYAHLPERFRAQRRIVAAELPDAAMRLALLGMTVETLTAAGYRYIGMDHFALPDDELSLAQERGTLHRNFQGYSTHADCDLIGLGVSAISHVGATFSQNLRELPPYEAALDQGRLPIERGLRLGADDLARADVIQQLMCHDGIDIAAVELRHHLAFASYFADALRRLERFEHDGLVEVTAQRIAVRPGGRLLLRNIAMCFDAYLPALASEPGRYSRTL